MYTRCQFEQEDARMQERAAREGNRRARSIVSE
jgi:hypothetical protein